MKRLPPFWLLVPALACTFDPGGMGNAVDVDAGVAGNDRRDDVGPDGGPPAIDAGVTDAARPDAMCEGDRYPWLSNLPPCSVPVPTAALDLNSAGTWVIDTGSGVLTSPLGTITALPATTLTAQGDGSMVRVTSVLSVTVAGSARLEVNGPHPLVIVSRGDVTIAGQLDAGAEGTTAAAGSRTLAQCATQAGSDGRDSVSEVGGGGGGGGGAFQGDGGSGAAGADSGQGAGGAGGAKASSFVLTPLRGGCAGGAGGAVNQASATAAAIGGPGGAGGGALQISSGGTITVNGWISVSGGGGRGGSVATGGGGGGSGGGLLLEAATAVRVTGTLSASGGAGASGGGSSSATGDPGDDGPDDSTASAAVGDCGSFCDGGNGGDGSSTTVNGGGGTGATAGLSGGGGGGGGGGGAGVILLRSPSNPATGQIAPPAIRSGL